jgi:hypothetical protein
MSNATAIEARLRRRARRDGLRLMKCRSRTPQDWRFGTFMLVDANTNCVVATGHAGDGYGLTLEAVENELAERR